MIATTAANVTTRQGAAHHLLELRWRNALAHRLGLPTATVQAAVGDTALGSGAGRTWRYFDTLVTTTPTRRWTPSDAGFVATYTAVVHNLVAQPGQRLRQLLGARGGSWQAFRSDPANLPLRLPRHGGGAIDVTSVLVQMFQTWAIGQLDPTDLRAAIAELRQPDPVCAATAALAAAGGTHAWTTTDDPADERPPAGARSLTARCVAGAVAVHAHFDAVWRIDGRPASVSTDTTTSWFDPDVLALAHDQDAPTVWRRRSPTWAGTFGPDGTLRRVVSGLIVADGIQVTVARRRRGVCSRACAAIDGCRACSTIDERLGRAWSTPRGVPRVIGLVTSPIETLLAR